MPSLFNINPKAVGRRLLLKKAQRAVSDFLDGLGDERLLLLVRKNLDLKDIVPPEVVDEYHQRAQKYRWVKDVISKEDIPRMVGPGRMALIEKETGGREWLERQVEFLTSLFA